VKVCKALRVVIAFAALALLGAPWPAEAGPLRRAHHAASGDDYAEARSVYARAEAGDAQAQARLGFMYEHGLGIPQDYTFAVQWYLRGAENGNATAQYLLGLMFDKGHGVYRSDVIAYKWLNLAASHATPDVRGYYLQIRDSVAIKLTPAQLAEAQWMSSNFVARLGR